MCNTVVNINSHTHDSDRIRAATTGWLPHRYGLVPYPGRVGDLAARDDQVIAELAAPSLVGGEMLPAGTAILLDLPTGDVVPRR